MKNINGGTRFKIETNQRYIVIRNTERTLFLSYRCVVCEAGVNARIPFFCVPCSLVRVHQDTLHSEEEVLST